MQTSAGKTIVFAVIVSTVKLCATISKLFVEQSVLLIDVVDPEIQISVRFMSIII
jgi:hypothetical protein